MKFIVFALLTIFCANGANVQKYAPVAPISSKTVIQAFNERLEERILGGSEVALNELPYMVAIFSRLSESGQNDGFCGGSLISERHVISAAHCFKDYTAADIILGTLQALDDNSPGYLSIRASERKAHEGFSFTNLDNDIALLTLSSSITPSANIAPIPIGSSGQFNPGDSATLSGWGKINDDPEGYLNDKLLKVTVTIVDTATCLSAYGPTYINDKKVCVDTKSGTNGACHGDSGSPLATAEAFGAGKTQIGIMSFGASAGCTSGFPNVFTRVDKYLQWIADNGGPSASS